MLNKLPPKVMETILGFLNTTDYSELAGVSSRMWKIIEKTPKHYTTVSSDLFGGYGFTTGPHRLQWATLKVDPSSCTPEEARLLYNLNPSAVLIKGCESMEMAIIFSAHLRLLLTNSTVREFYGPEFTYGSQFWKSLHMKAKHVYCLYLTTLEEVKPIFASFQMTGMSCGRLFDPLVPAESIKCLSDPLFCSMEKLHIGRHLGKVEWLNTLRAKDLKFGRAETDHQPVFDFLRRKIWRWVAGTDEIEKIQFCDDTDLPAASFQFETFIKTIPFLVCSDFGWVDRTYEGMYLILRATDGQALLAHYDPVGRSFYLLRCEYNFRRGRCLGSYQRNVDSLRAIRNLMAISSRLSLKNPKLAGDAKEKLREECSKFNKYNKGATEMDLLTDAIWRPKGERRSIWGMTKNGRFIDDQDLLYPIDPSYRHVYKFAKAFEERGVLPDIDEFPPELSAEEIEHWMGRFREFAL